MIDGEVTGDIEIVARLRRFPPNLKEELRKAVYASAFSLQAHVVGNKLSGQVLKRQTGTLAASIGFEMGELPEGFQARVGVLKKAVFYAKPHEYGFDGDVQIKPHSRKTKSGLFNVRGHVRHARITEKRFLRGSLAEKKAEFFSRIHAAVKLATK